MWKRTWRLIGLCRRGVALGTTLSRDVAAGDSSRPHAVAARAALAHERTMGDLRRCHGPGTRTMTRRSESDEAICLRHATRQRRLEGKTRSTRGMALEAVRKDSVAHRGRHFTFHCEAAFMAGETRRNAKAIDRMGHGGRCTIVGPARGALRHLPLIRHRVERHGISQASWW
jgi:hypothetical protein